MKQATGGEIKSNKQDEFQERYLAHQVLAGGKKDELIAIMEERHSNRRFGEGEPDIEPVLEALRHAPSSCDRFGVRVKIIKDRDEKSLLNGLLVGGVGFVYRAPIVLLLFANPEAYKGGDNGDEVTYNSYLDAGVMAQQAMLASTAIGLHCCFINPQIRKQNREYFYKNFKPKDWNEAIFMGAIAIGNPHSDPINKTRRLIDTVVVD